VLTDGAGSCDSGRHSSLGPRDTTARSRKIGIDVPVYPVKGYTATVPLDAIPTKGPTMGGVDEDRLIAYSRLGDRLRAGCAPPNSPATTAATSRPISRGCSRHRQELFPGAFDRSEGRISGPASGR
jgi:D-amino-acid dehydrogenase